MSDDHLHKQVETPVVDAELLALKRKIDVMQILYAVLFIASLVLLISNWQTHADASMHVLWAVCLGGAVIIRLVRQSMVGKYNSRLMGGRPGPLT